MGCNQCDKLLETKNASTETYWRNSSSNTIVMENYYLGILLGLLMAEGSWSVQLNAESSIEYTDIALEIPTVKVGCIIEVKYAENGMYDQACTKAIEQIEKNGYTESLLQNRIQTIYLYGIAFYIKKSCKITYCKFQENNSMLTNALL